jgi:probable rRNA maturation factor
VPIDVEISDAQAAFRVDHERVRLLVRTVLGEERRDRASISIALVDDATIHAINRLHLDHDWPTDVITFPLSERNDPELAGELIISAETALDSARERGIDPGDELALYIVHGLLHLCGYDDTTDAERARMRDRERRSLDRAGVPNPFPVAGRDDSSQIERPDLVRRSREASTTAALAHRLGEKTS